MHEFSRCAIMESLKSILLSKKHFLITKFVDKNNLICQDFYLRLVILLCVQSSYLLFLLIVIFFLFWTNPRSKAPLCNFSKSHMTNVLVSYCDVFFKYRTLFTCVIFSFLFPNDMNFGVSNAHISKTFSLK